MPLYEYACAACGHRFERLVRSFTDSVECPACRGGEVEKLLSTFAMAGASGDRGAMGSPSSGGGCCGGGCGCGH